MDICNYVDSLFKPSRVEFVYSLFNSQLKSSSVTQMVTSTLRFLIGYTVRVKEHTKPWKQCPVLRLLASTLGISAPDLKVVRLSSFRKATPNFVACL
ncbi:hypothetical protein AVEN_108870-1 [Araneus ventricosus]|uniref:Uncharacterized protein n=1 Tax=Araneus ventricosus TaxID=182803 RepID=A0A4Y2UYS3_ARAVE|nr:hypothetical protein AVEN_108870-1 [Araneus ventricosus]